MAIVPAEYCAIRGRFVPSRRPRPHQTKEARRVKSAGFLRGYSRAAFGRFAIVRDFIRGRLRNAWQAAPLLDLEWIADKQKPSRLVSGCLVGSPGHAARCSALEHPLEFPANRG